MNKIAGYTLGAVFLAAIGAVGYEAYKLNELVWDAPEVGDITFSERGDEAKYTIELERNETLTRREDFATELSVYFNDRSSPETPTQVCVRTSYELAGIFSPDPESDLLQKYVESNPKFREFTLERIDPERRVINNRLNFYTHSVNGCAEEMTQEYGDELQAIIDVRRQQLGLN